MAKRCLDLCVDSAANFHVRVEGVREFGAVVGFIGDLEKYYEHEVPLIKR